MELFRTTNNHGREVWVNPTHIVSAREDWIPTLSDHRMDGGAKPGTRFDLLNDTSYLDVRPLDRFLEDLRLHGLVPMPTFQRERGA